jgi:hypothetical protein
VPLDSALLKDRANVTPIQCWSKEPEYAAVSKEVVELLAGPTAANELRLVKDQMSVEHCTQICSLLQSVADLKKAAADVVPPKTSRRSAKSENTEPVVFVAKDSFERLKAFSRAGGREAFSKSVCFGDLIKEDKKQDVINLTGEILCAHGNLDSSKVRSVLREPLAQFFSLAERHKQLLDNTRTAGVVFEGCLDYSGPAECPACAEIVERDKQHKEAMEQKHHEEKAQFKALINLDVRELYSPEDGKRATRNSTKRLNPGRYILMPSSWHRQWHSYMNLKNLRARSADDIKSSEPGPVDPRSLLTADLEGLALPPISLLLEVDGQKDMAKLQGPYLLLPEEMAIPLVEKYGCEPRAPGTKHGVPVIEVSDGAEPVCHPPRCTKYNEAGPVSSDRHAFVGKSFAVFKKTKSWRNLTQTVVLDSKDTAERIKWKIVERVSSCQNTDPACIRLFFRCKTSMKLKGEKVEDLQEIALESGKTVGILTASSGVTAETHDLGVQVLEESEGWAGERGRTTAGFQGSIFAPPPRPEIVEIP